MSKNSLLVVGAVVVDPPVAIRGDRTLAVSRVPVEALKENVEAVLGLWRDVFTRVERGFGSCRVDYVDLTLAVAVDGSVGIFGVNAGGEASGGISVRLRFDREGEGEGREASSPRTKSGDR